MTEIYTELVSVKIELLMLDDLKKLAKQEQRTISNMVRVLLTEIINRRKQEGTFPED
jgi:hypothetical protein